MSGEAPAAHRAYAPDSVGCAVLTVSDSRTVADDGSTPRNREPQQYTLPLASAQVPYAPAAIACTPVLNSGTATGTGTKLCV